MGSTTSQLSYAVDGIAGNCYKTMTKSDVPFIAVDLGEERDVLMVGVTSGNCITCGKWKKYTYRRERVINSMNMYIDNNHEYCGIDDWY